MFLRIGLPFILALSTVHAEPVLKARSCAENLRMPSPHGEIPIEIKSRSQAERLFQKERDFIAAASASDEIPVEILVMPFYYPFWHTALRIGTAVYEFTGQGWEAHETSFDGARAYLYNNPFFRRRYAELGSKIPYFSLGLSLRLKKAAVSAFLEEIRKNPRGDGDFNFINNNCNHCLLRALARHDVDLRGTYSLGYWDRTLSSRLFRRLLEGGPHSLNAYPAVSRSVLEEGDFHADSLAQFGETHSLLREFTRLAPFFRDWALGRETFLTSLPMKKRDPPNSR